MNLFWIKTKKWINKTPWPIYLALAIIVEILLSGLLISSGAYSDKHGFKIISEVIFNIWFFSLGAPFLFLNMKKSEIDETHNINKKKYYLKNFFHRKEQEINKNVSFEEIESSLEKEINK